MVFFTFARRCAITVELAHVTSSAYRGFLVVGLLVEEVEGDGCLCMCCGNVLILFL